MKPPQLQPVTLRGGHRSYDPRLDRIQEFDERSRDYPITTTIEQTTLRSKWWRHTAKLDQGREGACVGFAWAHELNADPYEVLEVTDAYAQKLYKRAQQLDQWAGEDYSGTSVLAGAKAVAELGHLSEYRWAFGIEDVLLTLAWHGPVVLGIDWYYGMYTPDANRYIRPGGQRVGGHAIEALAYDHDNQDVWLLNSWGADWGLDGLCRIKVADLDRLLGDGGEACVPVVRGPGQPDPEPAEPEEEPLEPEPEPVTIQAESVDFGQAGRTSAPRADSRTSSKGSGKRKARSK